MKITEHLVSISRQPVKATNHSSAKLSMDLTVLSGTFLAAHQQYSQGQVNENIYKQVKNLLLSILEIIASKGIAQHKYCDYSYSSVIASCTSLD